MYRTNTCGELRLEDAGRQVTLAGWVQRVRKMGGMTFVDLRDRYGITQLAFNEAVNAPLCEEANKLGREYCIQIKGVVNERQSKNNKIPTGDVEIVVDELSVLSPSLTPPFTIEDNTDGGDDLRMKYRYLDLRRPPLQRNMILRHKMAQEIRRFLSDEGFLEIETPYLVNSTPEGARDFVVPSRMSPNQFYALPQSPQTLKQLLMVAGYDKYFQIVRCFRDEDLRADRQPEFTQIDCEMSFVEQEDVLEIFERWAKHMFKHVLCIEFTEPLRRMPWIEAMEKYGSDKPDLRFGMEFSDLTDLAKGHGFSVFDDAEYVTGFAAPGCAAYTRKQIDALTEYVKRPQVGAKGLIWIRVEEGAVKSSVDKFFSPEEVRAMAARCGAKAGDMVFILCGKKFKALTQLCALRLEVAQQLGLRDPKKFAPLWVVDFPMFEWDDETQRFYAMHHPFTMPYEEDLPYLMTDPARVRSQAYDVVLNGIELGSGSIRIHRPDVQALMFRALGFTEETARARFGFMIDAFKYGTPPHGGFAFGLDRLVMQLLGADSLRDVIAFPKVRDASDLMTSAPDFVDAEQLEVLQLGVSTAAEAEKHPQKKRPTMAIKTVAELAKLSLTAEEEVTMGEELNTILGFAEALQEVDTTDVPQTAHVIPTENVLREDIPAAPFDRDLLLSNAPTRTEDCVNVPQTFD